MKLGILTEYCTINMGQSPNSETYNDKGEGMPFYQGNADFGEMHPRARVWCSAPVKVAHAKDILISVRAPIGAMNIAKEECCIGRGLAALTPKTDKCSQKYLYYALQSKMDSLIAQGTGSTFKAISKKVLEKTTIPMYSLNEQRQIVDVIEKVEYNLSARRKQIYWLEQLVKSRFVELFGDTEYNTKGFSVAKLESLCYVRSSKRIYQSEQSVEGVPFLRISDLSARIDYGIETSELYISTEKYNELCTEDLVPVAGDILITSRGTIGKCYIVKDTDKFYFQDGMISWLSHINGQLISEYLTHLFSMRGIQKQILNLQAGSTVAYLSIAMLKRLNIILPPLELQNQFAAFVAQVDKSKYCSQKFAALCSELIKIYEQEWMSCQTLRF